LRGKKTLTDSYCVEREKYYKNRGQTKKRQTKPPNTIWEQKEKEQWKTMWNGGRRGGGNDTGKGE